MLNGHKWFCSAPMCDAFLVLAQAPSGLTCFVLPCVLPGGTRNGFRIERLKDKLGNRSNASSEIALVDAWASRLGEEGRGIATIIEMVVHTRLDCVLGATALMRRAHRPTSRTSFCATRLGGRGGRAYGTMPSGVDATSIVRRHTPRQ